MHIKLTKNSLDITVEVDNKPSDINHPEVRAILEKNPQIIENLPIGQSAIIEVV